MSPERTGISDDAVLGGRLRLLQPRRGHRFGHDAILLAAAVGARAGDHIVDLGAGVGAAGLALAARVPATRVTLVEIDAALAALAGENCARNALAERARAVCLDAAGPARSFAAAGLPPGSADHVMMNPPFNDAIRLAHSPDRARRAAHVAAQTFLPAWVKSAVRLLRAKGTLTVIYRADGLADVLAALEPVGSVAIRPVHPKPQAAAIRVIVRAIKGQSGPLTLHPGFDLNGPDGRPAAAAEDILRAGAPFTWS